MKAFLLVGIYIFNGAVPEARDNFIIPTNDCPALEKHYNDNAQEILQLQEGEKFFTHCLYSGK